MFNCNYRVWVSVSVCVRVCVSERMRRSSSYGQPQPRCAFVVFAAVKLGLLRVHFCCYYSAACLLLLLLFHLSAIVVVVAILLQLLFRICCSVCCALCIYTRISIIVGVVVLIVVAIRIRRPSLFVIIHISKLSPSQKANGAAACITIDRFCRVLASKRRKQKT